MTPSLEAIVDALLISQIHLSTDSTQVIYCTRPHGNKTKNDSFTIWLGDTTKSSSARKLTSGEHNDRLPRWSPDGKSIAFLSDRAGEKKCAVYLLHAQQEGAEPVPLTDDRCEQGIEGLQWSPDGKYIAYLSADEKSEARKAKEDSRDDAVVYGEEWLFHRLRIVEVATGKVEVIVGGDRHVASFAWLEDGKEVVFATQRRPGGESNMAHGVMFGRKVIDGVEEEVASFPTGIQSDLASTKKGVYFTSNVEAEENESAKALYRLDLQQKSWEKCGYGEENCAITVREVGGADDVSVLVMSGLNEEIHVPGVGVVYSGDHDIEDWDVSRAASGEYVVAFTKSSFATPPELFVVSTSNTEPRQISSHASSTPFGNADLCDIQPLSCNTPSTPAFPLHCLFVTPKKPDDSSSAPWATCVVIHGGPYAHQTRSYEAPHFPLVAAVMSASKHAVLLPNYRGGAGHGQAFASAIRGRAGTIDYDDVLAQVDAGIAQGLIDPDRIVIAGWSWGGMLSYLGAVRNGFDSTGKETGWKFKGAICGAGACDADLSAMMSDMHTFRGIVMGTVPWTSYVNDIRGRNGSAIWAVKKAVEEKRIPPVLILHGGEDPRVPTAQARAFNRAMEAYGQDCKMVIYPREGHMISERAHLVDLLGRAVKFLEERL